MLNPITNERELAYVVTIDELRPLPGYDRVEYARVNGWWVIVRKNQFSVGDRAVYIEVDSKVPENSTFEFLANRGYKVKTLKMCKAVSQGLLMELDELGLNTSNIKVGDFLTEALGITYADPEDNKRKAPSIDKYQSMKSRHRKLFKNPVIKWLMKYSISRKILFALFGSKKDKRTSFPTWVVKTDEERVQNCSFLFPSDPRTWIATEKIDGTSTTFTMKRVRKGKLDFRVCSRNVCFDKPNKKCFYEKNVYTEMADKYNIENVLKNILSSDNTLDFVTIQGETFGSNIQKRNYGMTDIDFRAFNLIFGYSGGERERFNPIKMTEYLKEYNIPCVPIILENFVIKDTTCDAILELADGSSRIDGEMREGLVFRSLDGQDSFKAVSNKFLLKYHS